MDTVPYVWNVKASYKHHRVFPIRNMLFEKDRYDTDNGGVVLKGEHTYFGIARHRYTFYCLAILYHDFHKGNVLIFI